MRIINTLAILCIVSFFTAPVDAQIYVDKNATGANSGTTWADAFIDLTLAIESSSVNDEIWIAKGTYLPGKDVPDRESFFIIPHNLRIFGGFDGSETNVDDRNPDANIVTLSGDYNGDDIDGVFNSNKEDNALHVMLISEIITPNTIIDGITFAYGATEDGSSSGDRRRGGGVLCYGNPSISNCIFKENYGWFGGGLYPRGAVFGSMFITNCQFIDNEAGYGAGCYITQDYINISDCYFLGNKVETSGGAIYNSSTDGSFTNCNFVDNTATGGRGGAIYNRSNSSEYSLCNFNNNLAGTSTGGAIHINSFDDEDPSNPIIRQSTFTECQANWGGAITAYSTRTNVTIDSCSIQRNSAFASGGGLHAGFGATINLNNCELTQNTADSGAAINSQNDTTSIYLTKCLIDGNTAEFGGAFNMRADDTTNTKLPLLSIEQCVLSNNFAEIQGGGLNLSNSDLYISNSLFFENANTSNSGAGGAMSINGFGGRITNAEIINSTFHGNFAFSLIGGNIAHYTDSIGQSTLTLQNNIFSGAIGNNYAIEDGLPVVNSNGGNLSDDDSMSGFLTNLEDVNQGFPDYMSPGSLDFRLNSSSPCINSGIDIGASAEDLVGNLRNGQVDKGAYEWQGPIAVKDLLEERKQLKVFPNPASARIAISLENEWTGITQVQILDLSGRVVFQNDYDKNDGILEATIEVNGFENGGYVLFVKNGGNVVSRGFLKM